MWVAIQFWNESKRSKAHLRQVTKDFCSSARFSKLLSVSVSHGLAPNLTEMPLKK